MKWVSEYSSRAASTFLQEEQEKVSVTLETGKGRLQVGKGRARGTRHRSLGISTPDPVFFLSQSDPWAHGETGIEEGLTSSSWLLDHLRKGFLEELLTVLCPMGARIKGILARGCLTHYLAGRRHSCRVFWV